MSAANYKSLVILEQLSSRFDEDAFEEFQKLSLDPQESKQYLMGWSAGVNNLYREIREILEK